MKFVPIVLFAPLLILLVGVQTVTAYSTSCNGLNASLGYRDFGNQSLSGNFIVEPNARLAIGCYWPGGTMYYRFSQGRATEFLWNMTNVTTEDIGSDNFQGNGQCVYEGAFSNSVPAGNYTISLYASGPDANVSCSTVYVLLSSESLFPTTTTTVATTTTVPPSIQQCNSPAQVELGQSLSCTPFSVTVTKVFSGAAWMHVYYNGQLIPGGNYSFSVGGAPSTVSFDGANATISLSQASNSTSPEYVVITLSEISKTTTSTSTTSSSTLTSTTQTTSLPTTTVATKSIPGLNGYYITQAQADALFGTSTFSYTTMAGLNAPGAPCSTLCANYNINSGEGVFMSNTSVGIHALEFVINSTEAETIYNFLINGSSINTLPKISPTTYGYGQSSGSNQGVNYTIAVTSPTGANIYTVVARKGTKVVYFNDMGITADQSPTGSATTLNTTLLINTIVADIAQIPPSTSSITVNTTTTVQTTIVQGSTGNSSPNILQQIWNAIVNFFSHL